MMRQCFHTAVFAGFLLIWPGFWGCGAPPAPMPVPYTGSLAITAIVDSSVADSIYVDLDTIKRGRHPNPFVLNDVMIGIHKLSVYDSGNVNARTDTMVEIFRSQRSDVRLRMASEAPYVGHPAPKFTVISIDDTVFALEQMREKVLLLMFFEHT